MTNSNQGDDRHSSDLHDPNLFVGESSSEEVAEAVEAIKQPRTATALEITASDREGSVHRSKDTNQSAAYALEGALTGNPSRKSTRGGANRIKPDSQLQRRQVLRTSAPKARAARGK